MFAYRTCIVVVCSEKILTLCSQSRRNSDRSAFLRQRLKEKSKPGCALLTFIVVRYPF